MRTPQELRDVLKLDDVSALKRNLEGLSKLSQEELDTILRYAVRDSSPDIIAALFEHGAQWSEDAEIEALKRADLAVYEVMLRHGWDIDNQVGGYTPVHLAVDDDTLPLLKWLLDHGANPNIRAFRTPHSCGDEDTPIEYAATRHETTGLQLLLEYGARPDTSAIIKTMSARKFRPYVSHIPHVKLLLDYGADINYVTKELGTPLHCAVEFGEEDMLRYLLERGADASIRDNFGMTPAEKAKSEGQTNCLRILEEYSSG